MALSAVLLASCTRSSIDSSSTSGHSADKAAVSNAAALRNQTPAGSTTGVNLPPDPGPFKLVELELDKGSKGEYWQARGELGERGGTMTVSSFGSGPKTFNLWAASDVESHGLGLLLFDPLVFTDAWSGKPIPRLAKSVTINPDNKTYTVKLRKGLRWSDGHPLTADDVVYTFGTIVKNGFGNSSLRDTMSVYGEFPQVEKVDDLTVIFRTSVPFAPFVNSLTSVGIAPKHKMENVTKKAVSTFHSFWDINVNPKNMVTCGPFKLERYVPGQRVELVRNPYYHFVDKEGTRLPYLDKMVIAIVPDQNTQILKFYGNEIDLLDTRSVRGFDAALMKQREAAGHYSMYNLGPDDGTVFLLLNMNQRKDPKNHKPYVDPVKQKWFNNPLFRQAVSHAINRQRIVNNVLRGVGIELFTAETPASLYYNKNLPAYQQDLNYAATLLKKAGFTKKADGYLYDSSDNRVEFTLHTNSGNTNRDATCIIILEDLKQLGIKVNYQPIDFNVLIDKTETSLDWEAIVMGLSGSRLEPYGGANVWKSDGRIHMFDQRLPDAKGKVRVPDARPWEKQIDQLFDKGAVELDEEKRHQYFDQFQKIAYDEVPVIYLYCQSLITAIHDRIGNYKPTPYGINYTPLGSMHNIEEIYVRKSKP